MFVKGIIETRQVWPRAYAVSCYPPANLFRIVHDAVTDEGLRYTYLISEDRYLGPVWLKAMAAAEVASWVNEVLHD